MAYSDEQLLNALRKFATEQGDTPTVSEANERDGFPSAQTYVRRFGSWNEALAEAGLEPNEVYLSEKELLNPLEDLAETLGRHPTPSDLSKHDETASRVTYEKRFGSWNDALAAAGLPAFDTAERYSDEELIATLRRLAAELGRPPRFAEVDADPEIPRGLTYADRFGSWNDALAAAGLDTYGYSGEELRTILRELADDLGRAPKTEDLEDETLPSVQPFVDRFGSWSAAVDAALDETALPVSTTATTEDDSDTTERPR